MAQKVFILNHYQNNMEGTKKQLLFPIVQTIATPRVLFRELFGDEYYLPAPPLLTVSVTEDGAADARPAGVRILPGASRGVDHSSAGVGAPQVGEGAEGQARCCLRRTRSAAWAS